MTFWGLPYESVSTECARYLQLATRIFSVVLKIRMDLRLMDFNTQNKSTYKDSKLRALLNAIH